MHTHTRLYTHIHKLAHAYTVHDMHASTHTCSHAYTHSCTNKNINPFQKETGPKCTNGNTVILWAEQMHHLKPWASHKMNDLNELSADERWSRRGGFLLSLDG